MSPEVLSFFDISVKDENTFEETGMNSLCSNLYQNVAIQNNSYSESSNLNAGSGEMQLSRKEIFIALQGNLNCTID